LSWQTGTIPNGATALSQISCATSKFCIGAGTDGPLDTHVEIGVTARTGNGGVTWSPF
jgi:hypothetical protein